MKIELKFKNIIKTMKILYRENLQVKVYLTY